MPLPRRLLLASLATLALLLASPSPASAQDARAILDALVNKGVLTTAEAEAIVQETKTSPVHVSPSSTHSSRLALAGRVQTQFSSFETSVNNAPDPASLRHFLVRRVYLTARADLGPDWQALITYNFSNSLFDTALIRWRQPDFTADLGWRMVNLGHEQRTGSGALKAIERSAVTRYFIESNNGRRLGGGSYRVGAFFDQQHEGWFWGAALTNPEQPTSTAMAAGPGNASNRTPAFYLNAGLRRPFAHGTLLLGTGLGHLPQQGGATPGTGHDLSLGSAYAEYKRQAFTLTTEFFAARMEGGAAGGLADASPWGFFVQPSYAFTPRWEGVLRIGYLDTDGRGVTLADAIPGAPSGGVMNRLTDFYLGGTHYFKGNDLKLQAGYIHARARDSVTGAPARSETHGFRSQFQINF